MSVHTRKKIDLAFHLKPKYFVASHILDEATYVSFISVLHDGSVAVYYFAEERTLLGRYDAHTGAKLSEAALKDEPVGMTSVFLNVKSCLALSYR